MPNYKIQAMDSTGSEITEVIEAADSEAAEALVRGAGYFLTSIREVRPVQPTDQLPAETGREWNNLANAIIFATGFLLGLIVGVISN